MLNVCIAKKLLCFLMQCKKKALQQIMLLGMPLSMGMLRMESAIRPLIFFFRMLQQKREPDNFTYMSVLNACSCLTALEHGRLIHNDMIESGFGLDMYIRSILIDMYAKGGSLDDAHGVFYGHQVQNTVIWTAMMAAYALHSIYQMVLHYFRGMQEKGLVPNDVTFLCLLSTCSYLGLIDDAFQHLKAMRECFGMTPTKEHYNCLLDLLGRTGLFNEVSEFLAGTVGTLNCVAWTSLLSSCRFFSNVDLVQNCMDCVVNEESFDILEET
ncbi:hypothetical protein L7F22_001528 [Adiantum nelumboides]|nr:hypothetical protein [Adiantum nelumboides]